MSKPITLSHNKSRMFSLGSQSHHLTSISSMNGGVPNRASPIYTMNLNSHSHGGAAYQLNLNQVEEVALSLKDMLENNTAKNIVIYIDSIAVTDDSSKLTTLKELGIVEYRTETLQTLQMLQTEHLARVKEEIAAQTKLQQMVQKLARTTNALTLEQCKHMESVLEKMTP